MLQYHLPKLLNGGALIGEFAALLQGDRLQQIGWAAAGVMTFVGTWYWTERNRRLEFRRKQEEDERRERERCRDDDRRNLVLDAVAKRIKDAIDAGQSNPFPELSHLILDPDDEDHRHPDGTPAPSQPPA